MTSHVPPPLVHDRAAATEVTLAGADSVRRGFVAWLVRSGLPRQGGWYVVAGVSTTAVHALLFLLLREPLGALAGNLVALVVTTLANTEFHRRITFDFPNERRVRRGISVGATVFFYASYSSAALIALQVLVTSPTAAQQTATIVAAATLGGIARFTLLRTWVFPHTERSG